MSLLVAEIAQNYTNLNEAKQLIKLAKENGADMVKSQLFDSMKLYGKRIPAELTFLQAKELFDYAWNDVGIELFFSVFDVERVKWCEEIGVKRYKVAYSQRNNKELRNALAGKDIIVSGDEHDFWMGARHLYCVSKYPAPIKDIDLRVIEYCGGFSDHTIGLDCAKIALACGAGMIEKHFAFTHDMGTDAPWSTTPDELAELRRWDSICKDVL